MPGIWGLLAGPIFRTGGILDSGSSEAFTMLAWNAIGLGAIVAWNGVCSVVLFVALKKLGRLRVSEKCEVVGLDQLKHDEESYPECECQHQVITRWILI